MKYTQTDKVFIDTNLWIYLAVEANDSSKHQKVIVFFEDIISQDVYTSIQAINEFHWVLSRKYNFSEDNIAEKVKEGIVKTSNKVALDFSSYQKAELIRSNYNISFWDSLMLAVAILADCSVFYSEDLQHNLLIDDTIKVINPFLL